MNAIVYDDYGSPDVLHRATRPIPQRLPGQILIRVAAASVNPIDYRLRRGEMKYLLPGGFPRIPGYDVAGTVADSSADTPFRVGDRVMAHLDRIRGGACADFATCAIASAARIPDSMPFDVAAAIPLAGSTALQALRDHGRMKAGQHLLINGASGGVGMFAVQIAKAAGCHVDAVASGDNEAFCLSLGADRFIDYQRQDFTESGRTWDLVFDAAGKASFRRVRKVLTPRGRYVSTEPDLKGIVTSVLTWPQARQAKVILVKPCGDDQRFLISLYESGQLKVTLDHRYGMQDAVEAHRRIENGVDRGKIVLVNQAD
ncbi:NAD(P)-dependent alcohol dehydrogenase [Roseiconus nitratireducens]|uniref:NAD(P)-dependent alcohol dehydrogenase n=2 Tax=Roseiconus nitratireducens TaxID=2605748 RepID=A0A5M6D807_9BACT|nr:NAD(P)-dependent alcohol dehydrogenase [Roseiconus nitratireducens]